MEKKGGFKQKKCGICNMKKISLIIILFLIPFSLFSQEWQFEPDSLRDDGPIIPILINPLIDGILPKIDYPDIGNGIDSNKVYNGFMVQLLRLLKGTCCQLG